MELNVTAENSTCSLLRDEYTHFYHDDGYISVDADPDELILFLKSNNLEDTVQTIKTSSVAKYEITAEDADKLDIPDTLGRVQKTICFEYSFTQGEWLESYKIRDSYVSESTVDDFIVERYENDARRYFE